MDNKEWEQKIKIGIKRGDSDSFRLLYKRFYSGLCQFACRYTSSEIAEDIVHDIFLKLWKDRKEIDIQGSIHSYLYTAVRNGSLNYLKHLVVERKFNAKTAIQLQRAINYLHISQEDGSSLLIAEELENSFREELESLPPKCREIFLLSREDRLKHSEIAKKLGISQITVQRQISIAIKRLLDRLLPKTNH